MQRVRDCASESEHILIHRPIALNFKILSAVILGHLLVFCTIWVGFPVLAGKGSAAFYYSQLIVQPKSESFLMMDHLPFGVDDSLDHERWQRVRALVKPRK